MSIFGAVTASLKFKCIKKPKPKKPLIRKSSCPLLSSLRFFTQLAVLKLLQFRSPVKIKAAFAKLETDCSAQIIHKRTPLHQFSGVSTVTQPF